MELEEIEALDAQPLQRALSLAPDALGPGDAAEVGVAPFLLPDQPALGEDVGPLTQRHADERLPHDFLGVAEAVGGGGVDPVDAQVERPADGGNRIGIVLRTPTGGPVGTAERPGAKPDAADRHLGRAEQRGRQRRCLRHSSSARTPESKRRRAKRQVLRWQKYRSLW